MKEKVRAHAVISGRVQGVFFRMETKRAAEGYGVSGWVRNRADGTVEAIFEGDRKNVGAAIEWCKKGPPMSKVISVDVDWDDYTGEFKDFMITY
ncbi:acylphosphatase [Thermodesulfobacteriota bacterium]